MTQKFEISHRNPVIGMVIALIASLLVLFTPLESADAAYTSHNTGPIVYNDEVCNLGDPANHQSAGTAFQISTPEELWEITDCVSNSATIYFELTSDIDVSQAVTASTNAPIGYVASGDIAFKGVLDGKNKEISGISMSTTSYGVGLFAHLNNATISNLAISGNFVTQTTNTNDSDAAGALAIRATGTLFLSSISNRANVTGYRNVAGLVGYVGGVAIISSSVNTGTISGTSDYVGGLMGFVVSSANVNASHNTGNVSGLGEYVGGLIAHVASGNARIVNSHNTGTISGTSDYVGGMLGSNVGGDVYLDNSHNTGPVSGSDHVGGLVGFVNENANITSSYNTGIVFGSSGTGGLVGSVITSATIDSSENTGAISGSTNSGGLVGFINSIASINASENTGTISGTSDYVGGLMGFVVSSANVNASHNTGNVFGLGEYVGGLMGYAASADATITASSNAGMISGSSYVGGLVGNVNADANIDSSENTGAISGSSYVGGLVGNVNTDANIDSSDNAGAISGSSFVGGLVGNVNGSASFEDSKNLGAISGSSFVGGLVGNVIDSAHIDGSYSIGTISATANFVGGLMGQVIADATITSSYNTGPVSGFQYVGGLVGNAETGGSPTMVSTYNSGRVSGENRVAGLVGSSEQPTVESSYNTGTIVGSANYVGGLTGIVVSSATITSSFNTGAITGNQYVGGVVGQVVNASGFTTSMVETYNTGTISGSNDVDGVAGNVQGGTFSTVSAFSSVNSAYVATTPVADMKLASTFVGFDFDNTWGFGSPNDNQGFPMLRVFAELTTYYSDFAKFSSNSELAALALSQGALDPVFVGGATTYTASVPSAISSITVTPTRADSGASITVDGVAVSSGNASGAISLVVGSNALSIVVTAADSTTTTYTITVTRAAAEQNQGQTPAQPPAYAGPVIAGAQSAAAGTEATFTGNRLESVTSAEVGGVPVTIISALAQTLTLEIPSSMLPGTYDLKLQSGFGALTVQNGISVTGVLSDGLRPVTEVEATEQKLTVGSFRGFVAIYTKGYEGQRLSAKVAGKWLVVESLDESFKGKDYSRIVRRTGSGYSIKVHLYIDREFVRTEELVTNP